MVVLLFFAFVSGVITILAPCIWPILPIVLSTSASGGKRKPLGVTLGVLISFAFFTLTISYIVKIVPFDPNSLRYFAVAVLVFFGLTLIVPSLNRVVEGMVSRMSGRFGKNKFQGDGFISGFITGLSLGIVWSPCAGPILATIATLAATTAVNFAVVLVTLVYVAGIGVPLFLFATWGVHLFTKTKVLSKYTVPIQQLFGIIMLLTALAIITNYDKVIQVRLLDTIPSYSQFLTAFESNKKVTDELNILKNGKKVDTQKMEKKPMDVIPGSGLPQLGVVPEFAGISKWLNTDGTLTMESLRGNVILIDFWTYTCINCIRTLPHVTEWYDKYKDKKFVVIGVHTPEFEFEKKTENVEDAIKRFNIHYPVAQDNNYSTWNAFNNQYWPAEYLIDAKGIIRHTHFGEGEYDRTEEYIQELLAEAGNNVALPLDSTRDMTPKSPVSPETYVGINRMERNANGFIITKGFHTFANPSLVPIHYFAFSGEWDIESEFASSQKKSELLFHFTACHVYLVMHPKNPGDRVIVYIDDKPITIDQSGRDVKNNEIILDSERLYDIVDLQGKTEEHLLKLRFENSSTESFAFTFG